MANSDDILQLGAGDLDVFSLLTRLSEILVKECYPTLSGKKLRCLVNRARTSLYGTLLGKYHVTEISTMSEKVTHMSSLSWLIAQKFILGNLEREQESFELDDIIKHLFELGWDNIPHPVLQTLICLTNSSTSNATKERTSSEPFSLSQRLYSTSSRKELNRRILKGQIYSAPSPEMFKPPPWMSINHSALQAGRYVSSFPFNQKPGEGLPLLQMLNEGISERSLPEESAYRLKLIPALTEQRDLAVLSTSTQSNNEDEGYFTPVTEMAVENHIAPKQDFEDPTKVWSEVLHTPLSERKSWETFGSLITEAEPPFSSSCGPEGLRYLSTLVNTYDDIFNTQQICDPKPVSREEFVRDIFLLLTGIESHTFPFDKENNCFVSRKGMWLSGYCEGDTAKLCQDFLSCGTHFKRLEALSHSSKLQRDGGTMMQSLMDCVQRWTQFYHGAVLILSSHFKSQGDKISVYELLESVQPLKQQVDCLSKLCCVDDSEEKTPLPSGVALLAHVYREASKSNSQSHFLYSALKSCCEGYLQCLQRWIFSGDCSNDELNEFFVKKDSLFSTNRDRLFWTRGHVLVKSSVPVFLQGLEIAIFDCGRAMNLLQLCSPQHPLCVLLDKRHPTIHCCLYKSDMEKVQKECIQFEVDAAKVCGDFMNVSKLLEEEKEQEIRLCSLMQKAQKERETLQASIKAKFEEERAKLKERQNADLKAQIMEIQQRKAAEKEQQRIADELYLIHCQRRDEAAKLFEKEQRDKVLAHYKELGETIDKQNQWREWQICRLKLADKRNNFLYEDSLQLARDTQLLDKVTSLVPFVEPSHPTVPCVAEQETPLALAAPSGSLESTIKISSHPTVQESNSEEIWNSKDIFKQASAIKAKVLDVEFGLVPSKASAGLKKTDCSQGVNENYGDSSSSSLLKLGVSKVESTVESSVDVHFHSQSDSKSDSNDRDETAKPKTHEQIDLIRNRSKIMTEHGSWMSNQSISKKYSEDSGIISDLERNRQRVLGGGFNIISGRKLSDASENILTKQFTLDKSRNTSDLSDLQKNRRNVLGEEYNILTGEKILPNSDGSGAATQTDSGVVVSVSENSFPSHGNICAEEKQTTTNHESVPQFSTEFKRPKLLSVNSEAVSLISPLTPHGHVDMHVFTSPFKGTNCLPNGLPLASPIVDFASEKITSFEVNGIPLMVDIADNFAFKFNCSVPNGRDFVDEKDGEEFSKTPPITSWLDSSLQSCLLLPLRVQYKYVSAALLHFFLVDLNFLTHIKSLRSYFLMQDGEFGRHITGKLFTQMYQVSAPDKLFNSSTLDKIVREALASSRSITDPNQDRLTLDVSAVPDHFSHSSLNVFDCLKLSYKVKWPLNLLLTPDVLDKYNLIFVFLVRLKRVAWLLQEDFVALKNTARGCFKEQNRDLLNSPQYHQVQMIRHCMSQFVQATLNYASCCVLHASWADFALSLKEATTVDHIYNAHIQYIKRLLKRCLLNNNSKRVEAVLSRILVCIIKFHINLRVRPWQVPSKLQGMHTSSTFLEHPNFQQLQACSVHFKMQVSKLVNYLERVISPPNLQQHLGEYLLLLNINGFFKSSDYLKHIENVSNSDGKSLVSSQSTSKENLLGF